MEQIVNNIEMKVRTTPCLRYLLIRYTQCVTHEEERRDGIEAAVRNRGHAQSQLTTRGRAQAKLLSPEALISFAMGPYLLAQPAGVPQTVFAEPVYVTDGSDAAEQAADAAGWPPSRLTIKQSRALPAPDDDDCVRLVFVMASALVIFDELDHHGAVYLAREHFGPPLGSITMLDVFGGGDSFPFIHCVANTSLCPDVCWWHNTGN